jgi:hypothetical protein
MRCNSILTISISITSLVSAWVHPGILHSSADLSRMETLVAAQSQPWYEAYEAFAADSHSLLTYSFTSACPFVTRDSNYSLAVCVDQFASDSVAALQHALMWTITETESYAAQATTILSAWGSTLTLINGMFPCYDKTQSAIPRED